MNTCSIRHKIHHLVAVVAGDARDTPTVHGVARNGRGTLRSGFTGVQTIPNRGVGGLGTLV